MRVIDGVHRLKAAQLRGEVEIEVEFFDGDEREAFVVAVEMNVRHGLPLTLADREAAAARILDFHPEWSDRVIASIVALSPKTVAAVRQRSTEEDPQLNKRVGRDGRVRPLHTARGRQLASQLIAENPRATVREIAEAAGISPGTVCDVRDRLRRGEDAVPPRQRTASALESAPRRDRPRRREQASHLADQDVAEIIRLLRKDPTLKFSENGRLFLRWLDMHAVGAKDWDRFVESVPPHLADMVRAVASQCAESWLELADQLRSEDRAMA